VLAFTKTLIKVSHLKNLVDVPDDRRKIHTLSIPSLGGIVVFTATIFALFLWYPIDYVSHGELPKLMNNAKYIACGSLILFFVGIKDDIIGTAAEKKLLAHVMVAFILVLMGDIRITGMKGIFGIYELPYTLSVLLSIFSYIVIVNAFNLIDGVDGLAAGVGLISCASFGLWFYLVGDIALACLSFALVGALLGFLVFNFSPASIFLGDSGSLTIGLIISVLSIQLIEFDATKIPASMINISKPVFVLSAIAYPLIDTLRVFIIRSLNGRSPFSADRNHIHHRLLDIGLTHRKTSVFVYVYSVLVIYLSIVINISPSVNFISMASVAVILLLTPYLFKKRNKVLVGKEVEISPKPIELAKKMKDILSN